MTILPSSYSVEFKTDSNDIDVYLKTNKKLFENIRFLYIANKSLKDKFFSSFKNVEKLNIKILILGELGSNISDADELSKLENKGIKNIIYVSRNKNETNKSSYKTPNYNNTFDYYFEIFFIQFIHDFVSLLTSKYNYSSISQDFNTAKRNFISKFKEIFDDVENVISLESIIKDDTFENEYLDEEDNINN